MYRKSIIVCVIMILVSGLTGCQDQQKVTSIVQSETSATVPQVETTEVPLQSVETTFADFAYSDLADYDFVGHYAGGYTKIHIFEDGSFKGVCDLGGEMSQEFPGGVREYCDFTGQLKNVTQENEYKITTTIESLQLGREPGTEEIRDNVKYEYSAGQGMKAGDRIEIFLPGTPISILPDEIVGDFSGFENLKGYALFNPNTGFGYGGLDLKTERKGQVMAAIQEAEIACQTLNPLLKSADPSQADMNGLSQLRYETWDRVLNTVWSILKDTLSEEEMEKLTQEQIAWIKEKEAAAEQAVVNAGGSSMAISAYSRTAKDWTIHRLEILIPMITGEQISLQSEGAPSFLGESWQEAYRKILMSDPADYLGNADGNRSDHEPTNQTERWIYLGIHDFDGDSIPELMIGDDLSLAVFAYYYGSAEKIADLYYPGSNWCVNGVYFKDNSLNVQCNGAGVSTFVNFGFLNGQYLLGLYDEMSGSDVIINGKISTLEEMNRIYPIDHEPIIPEEHREKTKLAWEEEKWVLHFPSGEIMEITESFDFSQTLW